MFLDEVFPLVVSRWGGGSRYKTTITKGKSGAESRNAEWQDALRRFNAAFSVKTHNDVETLEEFFHKVMGRWAGFLVKDYFDFKIEQFTELDGVVDGANKDFQVVKKYGEKVRNITKPTEISGLKVDGELQPVSGLTLDTSTGIVTFDAAPSIGTVTEITCNLFYVPCRFDTDEIDKDMLHFWVDMQNNQRELINIPDIPIVEIRDYQ